MSATPILTDKGRGCLVQENSEAVGKIHKQDQIKNEDNDVIQKSVAIYNVLWTLGV